MGTEMRLLFLSTETLDWRLTLFLLNTLEKLCSCELCTLLEKS